MAKGKQPAKIPPLPMPSAGSSSAPSSSLTKLMSFVTPALEHILCSRTNDNTAPAITVDYYSHIHAQTYNYFTAQSEAEGTPASRFIGNKVEISGSELYVEMDNYFARSARELFLGTPQDDADLIHYILPCFHRYRSGSQSINRLLSYVNRHYVKRAVDEDKGWLRLADALQSIPPETMTDNSREKLTQKLKDARINELKKWGYVDGGGNELAAKAEACAEAASPIDRVVPLVSCSLRRFRIEFIEPLLMTPKMKGRAKKAKNKVVKSGNGPPIPKGRLARAVEAMLESKEGDDREKRRLSTELADMLRVIGVRADHSLRKRLDKYIATCTAADSV